MVFFRRNSDISPYVFDDFGEWLVVNNKYISNLNKLFNRIFKDEKIKIKDKYIIYYNCFENFENIMSIKGFFITNKTITKSLIENNISDDINIYLSNFVKSRICTDYFIFFQADVIMRNIKNYNLPSKVMIPPLGVNPSKIPYNLNELFRDMFENILRSTCKEVFVDIESNLKTAKISAICRIPSIEENKLNIISAFSYFSQKRENIEVSSKRISFNLTEIDVNITLFKTKALIPLIWDAASRIIIDC